MKKIVGKYLVEASVRTNNTLKISLNQTTLKIIKDNKWSSPYTSNKKNNIPTIMATKTSECNICDNTT